MKRVLTGIASVGILAGDRECTVLSPLRPCSNLYLACLYPPNPRLGSPRGRSASLPTRTVRKPQAGVALVTIEPSRSSTRETPEMHVRFLAPDVAVMHSRFHIYGDADESERTSIGTRVVRKVDGRWRTVAVQNTDLRPGRRH